MKIVRYRQFKKNYKTRISPNSKLVKKFNQRLIIFLNTPDSEVLRDHPLIGKKKGYRAYSVTGDIRVVYKKEKDKIILYDIGTHNQVY